MKAFKRNKALLLFTALIFSLNVKAQNDTLPLYIPEKIFEQAQAWRENNEFSKAIDVLAAVPENDTSYFETQYELMRTYNLAGQFEKAKELGARLLGLATKNRSNICIEYGNSWINTGNNETAITIYREGLSRYPYNFILHNNLGVALYRSGRYEEAIQHFQESAGLRPLYANPHLMLAHTMIRHGQRTKAMLSLITYLWLNNEDNRNLVLLENLVNNAERTEGSFEVFAEGDPFYDLDLLMKSKAPLDERFRSQVNFNASLVKYSELLLEKLLRDDNSSDFWMKTYVPALVQVQQEGLAPALIYHMLSSTGNETVLKWLSDHQKEIARLEAIRSNVLGQNNAYRRVSLLGEEQNYRHWYYDNGLLNAIGFENRDESRYGPWLIYHDNGEMLTTGKYNDAGKKIGEWKTYYKTGVLEKKEQYNEQGALEGSTYFYSEEGDLHIEVPYLDGKVQGTVKFYYPCGQLKETQFWHNDQRHGAGEVFYPTSQKQISLFYKNEKLDGDYIIYFKSGAQKSRSTYVDGSLDGPYTAWYPNNMVSETGNYRSNAATGEWKGWHSNGKLRYEGNYSNDQKSGTWKHFTTEGALASVEIYDEKGRKHGKHSYFERGKIALEEEYRTDTLVAYTNWNKAGEILAREASEQGNMPYQAFNLLGDKITESEYIHGKVHGPIKYYHYNGVVSQEGTAHEGSWEGEYKNYYHNGALKQHHAYENKILNGYYREYFKNGNVRSEGWHADGVSVQTWDNFYPDGTHLQRIYLLNEQLHGPTYNYAPNGTMASILTYKKGILEEMSLFDSLGKQYQTIALATGSGTLEANFPGGKPWQKMIYRCGEIVADSYTWYPNGQLETKVPYANAERNGRFEAYFPNGQLKVEGSYLHDEQTGLWKWYQEDGTPDASTEYLNNERNGPNIYYYPSGQMKSRCLYKNGVKDGGCEYWSQTGVLRFEKFYEDDRLLSFRYLQPNGQPTDTLPIPKDVEFTLKTYYANKQLSSEQHYRLGELHGKIKHYHPDGRLAEEGDYDDGDLHGAYKSFYPNGQLMEEENFTFDERNGWQREYYPNGKVKKESVWKMGKPHGPETVYNPDGSVKRRTHYWNGEVYE